MTRLNIRIRILAWVHIVFGGVGLGIGMLLLAAVLLARDPAYVPIAIGIFWILFGVGTVYLVPSLIGGIGLLKGYTWARALIWMESALLVVAVPVGTAIAGLSIWAMVTTRGEMQTSADGGILKFEQAVRRVMPLVLCALAAWAILGTMLGIGWLFRDSFDDTRKDVILTPIPSGVPAPMRERPEFKMPELPVAPER